MQSLNAGKFALNGCMFTVTRFFCRMLLEGNKLNVISVDCSVIAGNASRDTER